MSNDSSSATSNGNASGSIFRKRILPTIYTIEAKQQNLIRDRAYDTDSLDEQSRRQSSCLGGFAK
jgi:hypothetical protein